MALPQRYIGKDDYSQEEYLRWEEGAAYKSEYVRGDIRAMSGGTVEHGVLSVSVAAELRTALRGGPCRVLSSDVKVRAPRGTFRYPDVSVVCGPPSFHLRSRVVIANPVLIVEVLSDGIEGTDQGEKLREYQMLESLQHYLLVSQHEPRIELYTRKDNGHWDYLAAEGLDAGLQLTALSVTLVLADIYEGIDFRDEEDGPL